MPDSTVEALEQRHSIWTANQVTWKEIEDVLFDHIKNHTSDYIPRGEDEEPADYARRQRFARFKGELSPVIHRLIGAVMSRPPSRPEKITSEWGDFIENCDGCQTHLDQFMEDRLFEAFGFGATAILIDRPEVDEQGFTMERTFMGFKEVEVPRRVEADEIIAVPYRISQVVDWSVDRCGEFNWVRLMEMETRSETPHGKTKNFQVYREFDRQSWRVFEVEIIEGEKRANETGSGDHGIGMVPLVVLYLQKEKPMSFYSPMRYAYQHDIANFVADADLQFDQWRFAHPTVIDYSAEESRTRVTVGPGAAIKRNPNQQEDLKLLEMSGSTLDQLRKSKEEAIIGLRRISGIDPLSSGNDPQGMNASGRSRAVSFSISEERHLRRASRALQNAERRIFEIGERWKSPRRDIGTQEQLNSETPTYPMVFTSAGTEGLIEQWLSTRGSINSETYDKQMQQKIVDSALGDVGSELRDEIMSEIDTNPLIGGATAAQPQPIEDDTDPESFSNDDFNAALDSADSAMSGGEQKE